ncbi:Bug family tripartite tricarboxylate transporter substrate binding protein [Falsiroseomonas oryziterrae]|uniref:Bug family tripartite tricarboxylate transporter substrate binding protein n=1 Tax=Falsiroseomonas oryziterrae TaxID=2911368 RepID=UPI001F3F60FB|nr:tripartite tricarboxylate transporter substrate binding protein [Roseomonas sp. NPKOSM-4]
MLRRHVLLGAGVLALPGLARAQGTARPLRIVVPFVPGGAIDLIGRLLAERLPAHLSGQTAVVDNRAGAGGMLGAENVARSTPDGTTLGVIGVSALCAFPTLYDRIPYEPQRDFTPVTQITSGVQLCVVNAETARRNGWTDFSAMMRWARANPGGLRGGSSGAGTTSHLLISALGAMGGAEVTHVPYRGGAPALQDMLTGTVDMMFDVPTILLPHVAEGRLRALAVSSADEFPLIPGVPGMRNFRDVGLGDLDVTTWNALMAPKDTPAEIVQRQFAAITAVAREHAFVERFRQMGFLPTTSESPAALSELIRRDTPIWRRLVEISGARLTV